MLMIIPGLQANLVQGLINKNYHYYYLQDTMCHIYAGLFMSLSHVILTASSCYFPSLQVLSYSTSKMWRTAQGRQSDKLTSFLVCVAGTNPERGKKELRELPDSKCENNTHQTYDFLDCLITNSMSFCCLTMNS